MIITLDLNIDRDFWAAVILLARIITDTSEALQLPAWCQTTLEERKRANEQRRAELEARGKQKNPRGYMLLWKDEQEFIPPGGTASQRIHNMNRELYEEFRKVYQR